LPPHYRANADHGRLIFAFCPMDPASLAAAFVAAQMARVQIAVAAKMARMDAQSGQSVADLIAAAEQNMNRLANVAVGVGTQVDITA
jgi:hypothetical protein